jgi:hypothetical protein
VTWTAPANTGASRIASYTIVTDPPTGPVTVTAGTLTAELAGLKAGGSYLVSAYATNEAGVTSPAATTMLRIGQRTPACPAELTLGRTLTCDLVRAGQVETSLSRQPPATGCDYTSPPPTAEPPHRR